MTQNIAEITERVLTEIKEPSTKARPIFTETLARSWEFKTFGEKILERMVVEVEQMANEMTAGSRPRWLCLLGQSGGGKTYMAKKLQSLARNLMPTHVSLINPIIFKHWGKLLDQLRDGDYWQINDISDANFVVLDDIGTEGDKTPFALEKMYRCITAREGKWTVITCNLSLEEIAERLDTRISSRMIREENVVVNVKTLDYALRPKT